MNKWLLAIFIAIGGFFSLSKGWAIIFTLPFWLLASPVLWFNFKDFLEFKTRLKITASNNFLFYFFPIAYILSLICIVGVGDTQDVTVFGIFTADSTGSLDETSWNIAIGSFWVFIGLLLYTTYRLQKIRQKLKLPGQKNILFWFSAVALCLFAISTV